VPCGLCLAAGCAANTAVGGAKATDPCIICMEELRSDNVVRLGCGHLYHTACLTSNVEARWLTRRINFEFMKCPACKVPMECDAASPLHAALAPSAALRARVAALMRARLVQEGLDKAPAVAEPGGAFHGDALRYAEQQLSFYECAECKEPYYGGRKECEAADAAEADVGGADELVCAQCAARKSGAAFTACHVAAHGADFIEFKCQFCCSVATFFCWGKTHFCTPCHEKQNKHHSPGVQPCKGAGKCPIGGDHGGNGKEQALRCSMCYSNTADAAAAAAAAST
jgi:E3 ubiquitin-protein ligase MYCBP2